MVVHGNLAGLRASQIQNLERLYQRRLPAEQLLTPEFARELAERSFEIKRQIGLIIDRFGAIRHVIVGDDRQIVIPDLSALSLGRSRLRGVRCLHTHLRDEPLSRDDLSDLSLLRLDMMMALQVTPAGLPGRIDYAFLLPPQEEKEEKIELVSVPSVYELTIDQQEFIRALEAEMERRLA
jgi:GTP-binding protein HflX